MRLNPALFVMPPMVTRWRPLALSALLLIAGLGLALRPVQAAPLPTYLQEALADFVPEVRAGWAYTVTTTQNQRRTTERFDPAKPPAEQWQLLQIDDRAPTDDEAAQYIKYKASQRPGPARATYTKGDIEPFSLKLVSEDADSAEFVGSFREQSSGADKMLAHLRLRLHVRKQPAMITRATIELTEPYSPVLTVKMNELVASIEFGPATPDRPSLPIRSTSHFAGRMLLFPVTETLELTYRDFVKSP